MSFLEPGRNREPAVNIFVDYDNLLPLHRTAGLLQLVTRVLVQISQNLSSTRIKCELRVYGGWYEGTEMTRRAQDLAVEIQRDFPAIVRVCPDTQLVKFVTVNAELAVSLLQEPSHHLFNTYRRKGKPANVRVEEPIAVGCQEAGCLLPHMKRLLKSGTCPKDGCPVPLAELVYRHEQKIVDTMLCCDLIHAGTSDESLVIVSSDDDFLPPIRALLLHGNSIFRFHSKVSDKRSPIIVGANRVVEMDL